MTIMTKETGVEVGLIQSWLSTVAYWVSQIGSPPLTGAAAALTVGYMLATTVAWQWTIFYLVLTILAPCLYIIWLVQRGAVSDFHLPQRKERLRPLLFSLGAAVIVWVVFHRVQVPAGLKMLASVNGLQAILFLLITLRWKISLHCAAAAILAELLLIYFGPMAAPFAMSVPLIAWSRLYLRRHTLAQTIAGASLGIVILTLTLFIYGF